MEPRSWQIGDLASEARRALTEGGYGDARLIEGRAVAVKAGPHFGNAANMVMGVSALPAGFSSPPHAHEAEEFVLVLSGSGTLEIEGAVVAVESGTVVVTPAGHRHATHYGGDEPLVVLWFYAPPGSETRWLNERLDYGPD